MKLTKKEELLALGSALYLLGFEVEASREKVSKLVEQGILLSSPEILEASKYFNILSLKFTKLETRFLNLKSEIEDGKVT